MTVDAALEEVDQRRDVAAQPDPPPGLDQVLAPDAAELGVVTDQVGQLAALLHQVAARQALDLLVEVGDAKQLAQHDAGVVEAQGLVEVGGDEEV